jgi:hypothetical protein
VGRGGLELDADWSIDDRKRAELRPTVPPFRPATSTGMQQVRVRVLKGLGDRFDYLFDEGNTWIPEVGGEPIHDEVKHEVWLPVKGLAEGDLVGSENGAFGTGRPRARRGFGYWGQQIGHLRDRSAQHFGARGSRAHRRQVACAASVYKR